MSYNHYICPSKTIQKSFVHERFSENFIKSVSANFSKHFGLKKLGIHHVSLPPGCRTSYPHAESSEEEFVYVVSGTPVLWLNGEVYALKAGCAVGFPAGTGICHSILNNSDEDVSLLVLGERTKSENKFIYPINRDLRESYSKDWWHDGPPQNIGTHNGLPQPGGSARPFSETSCVVSASDILRQATFSYPEDVAKETFGDGVRLTDLLGLKALGIWHERLAPRKRSSWPHSHKLEEEFAFILSGQPQIWLNGYLYQAKPGDGVFFAPGTNIAHTIINDTMSPSSISA